MKIAHTQAELTPLVQAWHAGGQSLALVPTMGALHGGHLALVREARKHAPRVAVSIFVNPLQFGPGEDFTRYPRPFAEDVALLEAEGVDVLYAPSVEDMYPAGFATRVHAGPLAAELEGAHRPGHFDGVATVVAKLFMRVRPEVAVFGEKDFQQLAVIRAITRDLDLGVRIVGLPTEREADGLARSSRNAYLTAEERRVAPALPAVMQRVANGQLALKEAPDALIAAGFSRVDYVALRDAETLGAPQPGRPCRLLAAAWLGTTRLIDNIPGDL